MGHNSHKIRQILFLKVKWMIYSALISSQIAFGSFFGSFGFFDSKKAR